jgi:1,4-alpha-glucan branching enzyme
MKTTAKKSKNDKFAEFALEAQQAKTVAVAGSFNQWKPVPLRKDGSCWRVSLSLPPGRHEYRFIVDGRWIEDPRATEWVANPFGGRNAVLTIREDALYAAAA